MKRSWIMFFTLVLLLCACSGQKTPETPLNPDPPLQTPAETIPNIPEPDVFDEPPVSEPPEAEKPSQAEQTSPPLEPPAVEEPEPDTPLHSDLYHPDYTAEQIIEFFEEVVLNSEYSDGTGDVNLVQKWLGPIYYRFYGSPTDADKELLNDLFAQLNAIPNFPGIHYAETESQVNVMLNFLNEADFNESFINVLQGEYAFGAAQFWYYTETNEIHTARIGYRTDIDQSIRNSVLVEEIINMLGITDTLVRQDSVTYQFSNENTVLSDVDLIILKLLFDPSIECGMDADRCSEIIRQLYY